MASKLPESTVTTVSAPGKVLLAGGYLVLESPNVGLVVATDKRFYCTVARDRGGSSASTSSDEIANSSIRVHSPQFHATWNYTCRIVDGELLLQPEESNASENGFVEKTLRVVLGYLWQSPGPSDKLFPSKLDITIRADNDFYSVLRHLEERNWDATPGKVASLPRFLPCPVVDGKTVVNKTGLGSSAALVTSLVGALLQSFGAIQLPSLDNTIPAKDALDNDKSLQTAHNLAQICHCHSQGKVGSGFDVSSAAFGSHVYQRFPKCILPDLLSSLERVPRSVTPAAAQILCQITGDSWKGGVQAPLKLPDGLELLLADVCGGSESPSMARKVLSWKQSRTDVSSQPYWENLAGINANIVSLFDKLGSDGSLEKYSSSLSQLTATEWKDGAELAEDYQSLVKLLLELRKALTEARTNLKAMGDAAGVPIEPDEQTALADATMALPGVVGATVPGAGGYDALACLYITDSSGSVRNRIGELWTKLGKTNKARVCPLAVRSAAFGEGLREVLNFDAS